MGQRASGNRVFAGSDKLYNVKEVRSNGPIDGFQAV